MALSPNLDPEELLIRARAEGGTCLGELLLFYRNYLMLLARTQLHRHLRRRQRAAGQTLFAATLALAVLRFSVDGFRDSVASGRFAASSVDRAAAVVSVLVGCGALVWSRIVPRSVED